MPSMEEEMVGVSTDADAMSRSRGFKVENA